jgi:tRNA (adenine37-N6)-methyltransferase
LFISESDILDGSPVIDIKPYLPYSDSFPLSSTGWVKGGLENIYEVKFQSKAKEQCSWLKDEANINLFSFAKLQLEFNPTDSSRKRISLFSSGKSQKITFVLAYRTWRIIYHVNEKNKIVNINEIRSGYIPDELKNIDDDKYKDKTLHKKYLKRFI